MDPIDRSRILNINVGILGHVDSGKTTLVKALSTSLSTAALDKNPQSQRRGITLDLGFSSFTLPIPDHLQDEVSRDFDSLQFTLVDCPGHASLIKTIIGGAQIIDMIVLVVDANKGIQTQTAECLVIGEITTDVMLVAMNKVDMFPEEEKIERIEKMKKKLKKVLSTTKFVDAPIIPTAAAIGGEKVAAVNSKTSNKAEISSFGVDELVNLIKTTVKIPSRTFAAPFYFSIDHCFAIKGHGTVLTGTVLNGTVAINDTIQIPELSIQRKVKSMQMFRKPVKEAKQGDRVGICLTNVDPSLIERGIAVAPNSVPLLWSAVCLVKRIRFFKLACRSGSKVHVSIGHTTIVATMTFFTNQDLALAHQALIETGHEKNTSRSSLSASYQEGFPSIDFRIDGDYEYQEHLSEATDLRYGNEPMQWALLNFPHPIYCPMGSLVIGSRLDTDTTDHAIANMRNSKGAVTTESASQQCRLAFYGPIMSAFGKDDSSVIRIHTMKVKLCEVFRISDIREFDDGVLRCVELIGCKLVSELGSITPFLGMKVETENGIVGIISGPYGSDGKFKVKFPDGVRKVFPTAPLTLRFKKYLNDGSKQMIQSGIVYKDIVEARIVDDPYGDHLTANLSVWNNEVKKEKRKKQEAKIKDSKVDNNINQIDNGNSKVHAVDDSQTVANESSKNESRMKFSNTNTTDAFASVKETGTTTGRGIVRRGVIDTLKNEVGIADGEVLFEACIVSGAFRMEENVREYTGCLVVTEAGEQGEVVAPFGKLGKCKVLFNSGCRGPIGKTVSIFT